MVARAFATDVPDAEAQMGLAVAAISGNQAALDLLLTKCGGRFDSDIAVISCATGNLDFIQYCEGKAGSLSRDLSYVVSLLFGRVHVLDWLHEAYPAPPSMVCHQGWWLFKSASRWVCQIHLSHLGSLLDSTSSARQLSLYMAACVGGNVDSLEWLHDHGFSVKAVLDKQLVKIASKYGFVDVLDWMFIRKPEDWTLHDKSTLQIALQMATDTGRVNVLDWWQSHLAIDLEPYARCIDFAKALARRHTKVLQWWQDNVGHPISFSEFLVERAIFLGLLCSSGIKWWIETRPAPIRYRDMSRVIVALSLGCHVSLLDQLLRSCQRHDEQIDTNEAAERSCVPVCNPNFPKSWDWLSWRLDPANADILDSTANDSKNDARLLRHRNALFLDMCWKAGWIEAPFAIELPSQLAPDDGCISVWEWALSTGMKLRYKTHTLHEASMQDRVHVLEWFARHLQRFELLVVPKSLSELGQMCSPQVLEWWIRSGSIPN